MDFSIRSHSLTSERTSNPLTMTKKEKALPVPTMELKSLPEAAPLTGRLKPVVQVSSDEILKYAEYNVELVDYLIKTLTHAGYAKDVVPFIIKERLCLWIGEVHHEGPSDAMRKKFLTDASDGKCAFFNEGLISEKRAVSLYFKGELEKIGHNYGLEEAIYLVLMAIEACSRFARSDRELLEVTNIPDLIAQMAGCSVSQRIWAEMIKNKISEKGERLKVIFYNVMYEMDVEADDHEVLANTAGLASMEDYEVTADVLEQYARFGIKMLNIPTKKREKIEDLLNHRKDMVRFLDFQIKLMGTMRDESMANNFLSVLPSLPEEMPAVILMGKSHRKEFFSLITPYRDDIHSKDTTKPAA
jgi:hypothetical protein